MKRTLLDITQKISRKVVGVVLTPFNLQDPNYWIFEAKNYRFNEILREVEYRKTQDRISIHINTQNVSNRDFLVEEGKSGILVKFIKANFQYELDESDEIYLKGDIQKYA
jgi:hypothetical protein